MTQAKKSPEPGYGSIAIYLSGNLRDDPRVTSFELRRDDFRNRVIFRDICRLDRAFKPAFAESLQSALTSIAPGARATALPEFTISLENVILRGLKVTRLAEERGAPQYVIHLDRHFGTLRDILSDSLLNGWRPDLAVDAVALDVLTDIAMPLLDLAEQASAASGPAADNLNADLAHRLAALGRRRGEILMNLDLLKRFVLSTRPAGAPVSRPKFYEATSPHQSRRRLDA